MKYFGLTFWKMSLGFLVLILIGLGGVYLINHFDKNAQSGILEAQP